MHWRGALDAPRQCTGTEGWQHSFPPVIEVFSCHPPLIATVRRKEITNLREIHELEVRGQYPEAIEALETLLQWHPTDAEVVIRLGFNLWLTVVEADRMDWQLPEEAYAARFVDLLMQYRPVLSDNADFCWTFGLGIELFWYNFTGVTEEEGKALTARTGQLDAFWASLHDGTITQNKIAECLAGRGVLAKYYAVEQPAQRDVQDRAR